MSCIKLKAESKKILQDVEEGILTIGEKLQALKNTIEGSLQGDLPALVTEIDNIVKDIKLAMEDIGKGTAGLSNLIGNMSNDVTAIKTLLATVSSDVKTVISQTKTS